MVVAVEWTQQAKTELQEIYDYLAAEAGKRTARKIVNKIIGHADILTGNPQSGHSKNY